MPVAGPCCTALNGQVSVLNMINMLKCMHSHDWAVLGLCKDAMLAGNNIFLHGSVIDGCTIVDVHFEVE